MKMTSRRFRRQRGSTTVELALVTIPFLLLLFGAIEFGRLLYVWNTVQEVTRNAARQAVVANFTNAAEITAIRRSSLFRTTAGSLPGAPELADARLNIRYLNGAGNEADPMPLDPSDNAAACLDASRVAGCIRFVEVCVSTGTTCNPAELVAFAPFAGFFAGSGPGQVDLTGLHIPISTVRMPVESLGFRPFIEPF